MGADQQRKIRFLIVFGVCGIKQRLHIRRDVVPDRQPVLVTERPDRNGGGQSVFAVDLIPVIPQVPQALLDILHRLSAAAFLQAGKVPGGRVVGRRVVSVIVVVRSGCRR